MHTLALWAVTILAATQAVVALPTTLKQDGRTRNTTCATLAHGSVHLISGGDTRPWTESVRFNHEAYAQAHGFTYTFVPGNSAVPRQPYWHKVRLLLDHLQNSASDDGWLVWVDDDIVFTDIQSDMLHRTFDAMVDTSKVVAVTEDSAEFTALNTGIIVVRRGEPAKQFIEELWRRGSGKLGRLPQAQCLHEQQALQDMARNFFQPWAHSLLVLPQRTGSFNLNTFNRHTHYDACRSKLQDYSFDKPAVRWAAGDFTCHSTGMNIHLRAKLIKHCLHVAHGPTATVPAMGHIPATPCGA